MATSVAIADDHPIVLSGLASLIGSAPDFEVIGSASSGPTVLELIDRAHPSIAVLDLNMPGLSGIGVLRTLQERQADTRVVLLAATLGDADVYDAVTHGAAGVVLKDAAPETLIDCLREVVAGGRWLPPDLVELPVARETARRTRWQELSASLTDRELDVTRLTVAGHANKEVAFALGLSEGTVKVHLNSIFRKLQIRSRADLLSMSAGLLDDQTSRPGGDPLV